MSRRLASLARTAYAHRKAVLAGWLGALVVVIALAGAAGGDFAVDYSTPGSQS
jgi:putative drug exporter of the RND superfamily